MATVTTPSIDELKKMMDTDTNEGKRTELQNYLKLARRNRSFISSSTEIAMAIPKHMGDPNDDDNKVNYYGTMFSFISRMMSEDMKVNGKEGQWSCGCFGSRWCDFEMGDFAVRVAFYSKKYSNEWKEEKPYLLQFVFDKKEA